MSYVEKEITIGELKRLYNSDLYDIELETPDGYQLIGEWFDKGVLDMVRITTPSFATECAVNHLIQLADLTWALASELSEGVNILTLNGVEPVLSVEYIDPQECYDFEILHPNHRYYGDGIVSHNSGKSYICSGNVVKSAQEQGVFVVLMDAENALDESWLQALGVDTDPSKLMKINVSMIDDVAKTISMFMKEYKSDYDSLPDEDRPKVLFVVDSLGMLLTPTDVDQFNKGDMKGDMGRKPKALASLVRNTVNMIAPYDIGLLATNHTYASQDMFSPDDKISGGQGFVYASSILVAMKKKKLKDKDLGGAGSEVKGIKAACKVVKSRYAKPFESVDIFIPYEEGMNEYSGLFDLFEKTGFLTKQGNRYRYVSKVTGEEIIEFRKKWETETNLLDQVMEEFSSDDLELKVELNESGEIEYETAD